LIEVHPLKDITQLNILESIDKAEKMLADSLSKGE